MQKCVVDKTVHITIARNFKVGGSTYVFDHQANCVLMRFKISPQQRTVVSSMVESFHITQDGHKIVIGWQFKFRTGAEVGARINH
jgi:hypothetical protein